MKNKWRNYALKDGKIQSSYIREYCNRKKVRKTREASCSNSLLESGQKSFQEPIGFYEEPSFNLEDVHPWITNDEWIVNILLQKRRIEDEKSATRIGQPVQSSGEIGSEIRSIESICSSGSCGDEKVRKRAHGKNGSSRKSKKKVDSQNPV